MKGSRKKMWVLKMWSAHVQACVIWWWSSFYADDTTLESWAMQQGHELCVHWDNCVQMCKQFCEQLNRNTGETKETNMSFSCGRTDMKHNKGTRKMHSVITFSHMLGTSNSDSNTVLLLNVSGQWSREFQPLCFPYLDSPDSQSHVLGYSQWTN